MTTMAITAADVNKLRQMTGAGMMDCKKALTEANGDFEKAIDELRKKDKKLLRTVATVMQKKVWLLQKLLLITNVVLYWLLTANRFRC
jgi:hypothetical protein